MSIFWRCPFCKSDQSIKNKVCKKCGKPFPRQNKIYRVIVKHNNKTVSKIVPGSLELAKEIEAKIKAELVSGEYYDRRRKIPTLNEVWEKYVEVYKLNGKSLTKEKNRYDTLIKDRLGKKKLEAITVMDIQRLIVDMKKTKNRFGRPYSNKSIRNTTELISRLFNFALKHGLYDGENPVKKANLPKVNNEVVRYLSDAQIKNLVSFLDSYQDKEVANIVKLLLYTGIRRGEAFKLTWDDVDLENGILYLRDPKGGKDQYIPINSLAKEVLKDQLKYKRKDTNLVFPSKKNTVRSDINLHWKKIKKGAGLPDDFRLHDLRHTFASLLASSGKVDLYTLQRLMTHKSPQMTQRYAHLIDSSLKQSSEVLKDIINNSKIIELTTIKKGS